MCNYESERTGFQSQLLPAAHFLLGSFPSSVTPWGCCESLQRECLNNATQEPGTGRNSKCASVSNVSATISLAFPWEGFGQDDMNPPLSTQTCQDMWPKVQQPHIHTANLDPGRLPLVHTQPVFLTPGPGSTFPPNPCPVSPLWSLLSFGTSPPAHSPSKPCLSWCLLWCLLCVFQPGQAQKSQVGAGLWLINPLTAPFSQACGGPLSLGLL